MARESGPRTNGAQRDRAEVDLAVGVAAEVKNKLSVVDVVGETVQLKKAGTRPIGASKMKRRTIPMTMRGVTIPRKTRDLTREAPRTF